MSQIIPLFPLKTVLFPRGFLPLRVFEPRYLDMISCCMKSGEGIGVVLIRDGQEVGPAASTYDIGTLTQISYWHKRPDGLLGVTLSGSQRFRILSHEVQTNQLVQAEVELLPPISSCSLHTQYQPMAVMLEKIITQLDPPFSTMDTCYDDGDWVSARLIELLPLPLESKQHLFLLDDVSLRLQELEKMLSEKGLW
ncbi:MAG: peptidase S16 [Gammaproteobacteria bacterium]|nr:peptidase S16 [Gammaproteobacteria bacterium]